MGKGKAAKPIAADSQTANEGNDAALDDLVDAAVEDFGATSVEHYFLSNYAAFVFCHHLMLACHQETAEGLHDWAKKFYDRCNTCPDDRLHISDEYGDPLPFDEFWLQVVDTWGKPRFGAGQSPDRALELARKMRCPDELQHITDGGLRLLAMVCKLMQLWHGGGKFFLNGIDAAPCFGKTGKPERDAKFGRRKLGVLCSRGVLERLTIGHTGNSSYYRYLLGKAVQ